MESEKETGRWRKKMKTLRENEKPIKRAKKKIKIKTRREESRSKRRDRGVIMNGGDRS